MSKKFDKLVKLLKELFQLDQPDLDFGLYRIMHSRSKEISEFLEKDLLGHVKDAFGDSSKNIIEELKKEYDTTFAFLKNNGVPEPTNAPTIIALKEKLDAASEIGSAEDEIYDHLYRFFERYYDGGDFMSLRYLTRETSDKANAYAIPYDGSEVKLHWANADQYYVKTTEYFNNYTFKLRPDDEANPLRVHFRIADASEGEHGNIKESADKKRFFILYKVNPVSIENGELVIRFEFRNDADKTGQDAIWQRTKNEQSVTAVFEKLAEMEDAAEYKRMLSALAPTDKDKNRTTLAKYLTGYTSRNTMDYFIHKDLGGFLRRELDFYIKNEIMRLDDIENAEAPKVEHYLGKIKVYRKIAKQIIAFLAQLEDFQKKLWLKKKFVYETNYCITLDRIPEEFYPEIAANERQRKEWVKLFAIDEIKPKEGELFSGVSYSEPLTIDFLKANPYLVLDTALFEDSPFEKGGQGGFPSFKSRLIASIENFDEQCDGLLIHSENFQALNLLQERYREQVKCIYVDPPYNTGKDGFIYKDNYQHSTWNSFIYDRISLFYKLLGQHGAMFCSIDDNESQNLEWICNQIFGFEQFLAPLFIQVRYANKTLSEDNDFQRTIEHIYFYAKNRNFFKPIKDLTDYPIEKFCWKITELNEGESFLAGGKECTLFKSGEYKIEEVEPNHSGLKETWATGSLLRQKGSSGEFFGSFLAPRKDIDGLGCLYKVNGIGEDGLGYRYFTGPQRETATKGKFYSGIPLQTLKKIEAGDKSKEVPIHNFFDFSGDFGNCRHEGRVDIRGGKKPEKLLERLINFSSHQNSNDLIFDPFGGSGTTPSLSHKLKKKYISVEQSDYFDSKILNRMKFTLYGISGGYEENPSGFFKYIRLESYEDTLNNLELKRSDSQERLLMMPEAQKLKEDYLLNYMLDVETRVNASLLNIEMFAQPDKYRLKIKRPGSDEYEWKNIDLIETFNYLIGLRVVHYDSAKYFTAEFKRVPDPDLPEDYNTRLQIDGKMKQETTGKWWFRKIEGWLPKDSSGAKEKVLIVWRNLTGDLEQDNLMLDTWFEKNCLSSQDMEFDTIYVNGSNNLPNLLREGDIWKVRLIEQEFKKLMWDVEGV